jgi:DNA polymerase-3 subunit epsilon
VLLVGIDMETTGLEFAEGHRIVEFAVGAYDEHGERVGGFVKRYNPQRPIDPKASAVHGIAFEAVADCGTFDTDALRISTLLNKADAIIAHNGQDFDLPFLNHELLLLGVPIVRAPLVDTMVQGRWATPTGKVPTLGELCFATGISYDTEKAHAADYDVAVMMAAFFKGWKKGFFTIPAREERLVA